MGIEITSSTLFRSARLPQGSARSAEGVRWRLAWQKSELKGVTAKLPIDEAFVES
jgi:hypothetical protein